MRISIKNRCLVIITMLAFIMTSILPGVVQANPVSREASDIYSLSSLSGERQVQGALTGTISGDFSDIKNHPAEATIRYLKSIGMVSGYPDGSFRPDNQVSQLEAIVLTVTAHVN